MKVLISILIGLLVVACGKQEQADADESTPTTNTNKADGTTVKPVKEPSREEKVVGTYEAKHKNGDTYRGVLLDNGITESYINGKKREAEAKWTIINRELHIADKDGDIEVYRINKDGSITIIATIDKDGERKDLPKDKQETAKKIK